MVITEVIDTGSSIIRRVWVVKTQTFQDTKELFPQIIRHLEDDQGKSSDVIGLLFRSLRRLPATFQGQQKADRRRYRGNFQQLPCF